MSTTIGRVLDAVNPAYWLEVYTGTGGVALYIHGPQRSASKFWLNADGIRALVELLQQAEPRAFASEDSE